jgi:hypothetical protein
MSCPRCGAEILDPEASFCPRCATPLGAPEGDVTIEINDPPDPASDTRNQDPRRPEPEPRSDTVRLDEELPTAKRTTAKRTSGPAAALLKDFWTSARRSFDSGGWVELIAAAAFGLLAFVAIASILVMAAKLQHENLGAGADPVATLSALVIAALGAMRVPIHIGELSVSALPLGALAGGLAALAWATARTIRKHRISDGLQALAYGAKVAVPFALICWIASLIFRIRQEPTPVAADAPSALLLGALWGLVAGVIAAVWASPPVRRLAGAAITWLRERYRTVYEGLRAGGVTLLVTFVLAAAAALLWIIVALLTGRPAGDFGVAEAVAGALYIIAFAPNIITVVIAVGLGAPVEVGAQISAGGQLVGPLQELSLWGWAGGDTPWYLYLLVLIPLIACLLGGFAARRHTSAPRKVIEILAVAAATYAVVLFELAALSEARLGAGLVAERGFARLAPQAGMVLLLAFVWAAALGFVGWKIAESQDPSENGGRPQASEPPPFG